jgi:hypothetical protein
VGDDASCARWFDRHLSRDDRAARVAALKKLETLCDASMPRTCLRLGQAFATGGDVEPDALLAHRAFATACKTQLPFPAFDDACKGSVELLRSGRVPADDAALARGLNEFAGAHLLAVANEVETRCAAGEAAVCALEEAGKRGGAAAREKLQALAEDHPIRVHAREGRRLVEEACQLGGRAACVARQRLRHLGLE